MTGLTRIDIESLTNDCMLYLGPIFTTKGARHPYLSTTHFALKMEHLHPFRG